MIWLVCGFALLNFGLFYIAYKYLFLYSFEQEAAKETGGLFFKTAINQLFAGIYIQHLCLVSCYRTRPSASVRADQEESARLASSFWQGTRPAMFRPSRRLSS